MQPLPTGLMPVPPAAPTLDERGRGADGAPLRLDRRLFFSLLVLDGPADLAPLAAALPSAPVSAVLYADAHHPRRAGLLAFDEDPAALVDGLRAFTNAGPFADLQVVPDRTLLGRTYSLGYERDLEDVLVGRPRRRALDPAFPWHVWYPIRRRGAFDLLDADAQRALLMEHGGVGRGFGEAGLAHDIRLATYGLDRDDADFVAGVVAPTLTGASALVQAMRKTRQTAEYLERLGPFFVGHVVARHAG